jgi:hypothetical protein
MPTSDRFSPKGENSGVRLARIEKVLRLSMGLMPSLIESWRLIVSVVYEKGGVTLGRVE